MAAGGNCSQHTRRQTLGLFHSAATAGPVGLPRVTLMAVTAAFKSTCSQTGQDISSETIVGFVALHRDPYTILPHYCCRTCTRITAVLYFQELLLLLKVKNVVYSKSVMDYVIYFPTFIYFCLFYLHVTLWFHTLTKMHFNNFQTEILNMLSVDGERNDIYNKDSEKFLLRKSKCVVVA